MWLDLFLNMSKKTSKATINTSINYEDQTRKIIIIYASFSPFEINHVWFDE